MLARFAFALPVLHTLLALDLLLLASTVAVALRLLSRVRIAPKEDEDSESEREPDTRPSFTLIPPQRPAQPQSQPRTHEPEPPPSPLAAEPLEPTQPRQPEFASPVQFFEEEALDGIVADPIDGAAFLAGETVLVCRCGTGYHQETAVWLREQLAGKCVHCGAINALQPRRVEPRAIPRDPAWARPE